MKKKPKRQPTRKTVLLNVWLPRDEKQKLVHISEKIGVDQSKLTRHALGMLFDAYTQDKLQLGLNFPRP